MGASSLLHFATLSAILSDLLVFAGHVALGLIIFAIGVYLANLAADVIADTNMSQKGLIALLARIGILILTAAMALRQMGLANEIINLAFGLLLGAIAVAAALAFGLGGREVAKSQLEKWFQVMQKSGDK
jgi:hypothetical protein